MSDLHTRLQVILEDLNLKLQSLFYPYNMHFLFVLIPYDKKMVAHISTEGRKQIEKRVNQAAQDALTRAIIELKGDRDHSLH